MRANIASKLCWHLNTQCSATTPDIGIYCGGGAKRGEVFEHFRRYPQDGTASAGFQGSQVDNRIIYL
eukprot:scaffold3857_cov140-Skeletonema_menzelii.AAC.10